MFFEEIYEEFLAGKMIRRREWEPMMHINIVKILNEFYALPDDHLSKRVKSYRAEYTNFFDNNILISKGWETLDGKHKDLDFLQALQELKKGNKLMHIEWIKEKLSKYMVVNNDQIKICTLVEFDFIQTYSGLIANDWEVIQEGE